MPLFSKPNPWALWWDDLKIRIRIVSIAYCSKRKAENGKECETLRCELEACEPGPEYARLKDRLWEMYDSKFRILREICLIRNAIAISLGKLEKAEGKTLSILC